MWLTLLAIPPLLLAVAWPTAALLVDGPRSRVAASIIAGVYACGMIVFMIVGGPIGWGGAAVVLGFLSVLGWWLTLRPSSDREWETSLERTPIVERDGDAVTIHNVRNFRYRTTEDFDEPYADSMGGILTFRESERGPWCEKLIRFDIKLI